MNCYHPAPISLHVDDYFFLPAAETFVSVAKRDKDKQAVTKQKPQWRRS